MRRICLLLLFLIIMAMSFLGCDNNKKVNNKNNIIKKNEAEIVPENGGYIVYAITREPLTLNPLLMNDVTSIKVASMIYEGLIKYEKDDIIGVLAENWEFTDQGMGIIFHLKKNVRWHDGMMFNAYDVKYTYDTIMKFKDYSDDSGNISQHYPVFDYISDFKVLNDYQIKVSYKQPYARTLDIWTVPIIPRHIFSKYNSPSELVKAKENREPVGTGRYRFGKWVSDERIILHSWENYHGRPAYIDKMIFSINPEQSIVFLDTLLQKNDIAELTATQFSSLMDNEKKKFITPLRYSGKHYMFLAYNNLKPPFDNKRIREALSLGINKDEIIKGVLEGYGEIAKGPYYINSWANNPEITALPHEQAKAIEILSEEGWEDTDGDGVLDKDGKKFEFDAVVDVSEPIRNMALKFIKRNLKRIGVQLNIISLSWNSLLSDFVLVKKFDAVIIGWDLGNDPDDIYSAFHSKGPLNFVSYKNIKVDELLDKARTTFDRDIRKECYHEIHSLIVNDYPYTFLYVDDILGGANKKIKGINTDKFGLNDIHEWYVNYRTVVY
ncbi:MAG: ABC transporter substrate-binding protein [Candidatus Muirbacterium halophilum]|nr:ABC transporter substrate-binding protein [Candidatus Muirbacterium halophilum]